MIAILPLLLLAGAGQDKIDCDNAVTQSDMTGCAGIAYQQADTALNAQWLKTKAAMAERDKYIEPGDKRPTYSAALLASQRAWLAYRDAQCRIDGYSMRGGSAEPMEVNACLADLTKKRTKELADIAAWN